MKKIDSRRTLISKGADRIILTTHDQLEKTQSKYPTNAIIVDVRESADEPW